MARKLGCRLVKISGSAQICVTDSFGRKSQRILNAVDDKEPYNTRDK